MYSSFKNQNVMKKFLGVLAIAGMLVACKGNKSSEDQTRVLSAADSVQLKLKAPEEQKVKKENTAVRSATSQNTETAAPAANQNTESAAPAANTTTTEAPAATTKKKGWSKGAQGAVIGGTTGAVAGAIISKNKVAGAAVGAVVGAGVGYGIGHAKDKKDGRVKQ